MRKVLMVLLWLGLALSVTMMISAIGQKNALQREEASALKKLDSIQARYDEAKEQLDEAKKAAQKTAAENMALIQEKSALEKQLAETAAALQAARAQADSLAQESRSASEALETARMAWEEQRMALTAEKDATDNRLNEALAVLLSGMPEEDGALPAETDNLFAWDTQDAPDQSPPFEADAADAVSAPAPEAAEREQKPFLVQKELQ